MVSGEMPRQPAYRGLRTGGRSERVRAAIMGATIDELVRSGFADLSMAQIAIGADVALTTVHRRWATKGALVGEAILDALAEPVPAPDHGSLQADFAAIADAAVAALRNETVSALMRATMLLQPVEFGAVQKRIAELSSHFAGPVISRAVARGELPEGTNPEGAVERLLAGIWMRLFVSGGRLDERDLESFVADALAATRAAVSA